MRPSASFALLFMLTLVFLNGAAEAQSAGPAGQSGVTAPRATVENAVENVETMVGDTLANSTWIDMVTADVTADATPGDADGLDKIAVANAADRGHAPSVNMPVMQLAASTMAVNFKARDRAGFGATSSAAMRMPTALSLLTISLIVLTLFEHRRRQP